VSFLIVISVLAITMLLVLPTGSAQAQSSTEKQAGLALMVGRAAGDAQVMMTKAQYGLVVYLAATNDANLTTYVNAVEQADAEAALQNSQAQPTQQYSAPSSGGASGDCFDGSPIPAWIVNRESGGDPNAVNPSSGAYGCYQELPGHFNAGAVCGGLSMYSVADQKTCAQRLIDAAGGSLAPWAE
jgi:type II secretory pathway pseudopilin PulG